MGGGGGRFFFLLLSDASFFILILLSPLAIFLLFFPSETPTRVLCACLGCGGRRRRGGKGGGWLSRHARKRPETREAPSDDDAKEGFIKHGV